MFKKEFACNGTVASHPEYGEVIQLQVRNAWRPDALRCLPLRRRRPDSPPPCCSCVRACSAHTQGDQRKLVCDFLSSVGIAKPEQVRFFTLPLELGPFCVCCRSAAVMTSPPSHPTFPRQHSSSFTVSNLPRNSVYFTPIVVQNSIHVLHAQSLVWRVVGWGRTTTHGARRFNCVSLFATKARGGQGCAARKLALASQKTSNSK